MTLNKRRPRHQRAEADHRPVFRLTEQDAEILKAVNDCRALLTRQVERMFYTSPTTCYKRLAKLYHHEYLERHFITQVAKAPAASPIVYTITKLAASVLAVTYQYTPDQFRYATKSLLAWDTLQHILAINDVYAALYRACRERNVSLIDWQDELWFRADPDMVWLTNSRGTQSKKPVLPDGYFQLKSPQGNARFFLEIDLGTEGTTQFKSQVQVYQEYILSGAYEAKFQAKSLRILVVTVSEQHLATLKRAIAEVGGGERYWLTTFEKVTPEQILTAPIWHKVREQGLYALLTL